MKEKERPSFQPSFPKNFFSVSRPEVSTKEALKDVIPINWSEKAKNEKKQSFILVKKKIA